MELPDPNQPIFKAYRIGAFNQIGEVVEKMMTCDCETCNKVQHVLRADLIAQALIDVLAAHLMQAYKCDLDGQALLMIEGCKQAHRKVDRYFTEFGDEAKGAP